MKSRSLLLGIATLATIPALVFGVGLSSAQAATPEETSAALVSSALDTLNIEVTDETLLADLETEVALALEEGTVDPAISDSTNIATDTELADLIDENLDEESATWEEIAPAWKSAFETIRAEFEACRTDGKSTSTCARTLGFQLQIAHAEAELAVIDEQIAEVANLPEEEQAAALAELEAQRAELQTRLEKASTKLADAVATGTPGADVAAQNKLNSVINKVKGQSQAPALPEQAQSNPQTGTQPNTEQVEQPAPSKQSGSVKVEQAPGNSGSAGRPENPGSQGQGNNKNNR